MPIFSDFKKQPGDEETISLEWSPRLASGDSLNSINSVTCTDGDGNDVTSSIIDSQAISGTKLYLKVINGSDGDVLRLEMKLTTTNGDIKEGDMFIIIEEEP